MMKKLLIYFWENIKKFGILNSNPIFKSSKIIDKDIYIESIINWINKGNINSELLYRLTDNGEEFSTFHELCDNKCPIVVLFHLCNGNKIGIYSPISFDSNTKGWKHDNETFVFNLNQNKKYKKARIDCSLYCSNNVGPYTDRLGCHCDCKTMKKIVHSKNMTIAYENGNEILPSDNETIYYDLLEVEIFHILFENNSIK